jgi:hypothetical protein
MRWDPLAVDRRVEIGAAMADHPSFRQAGDEEHPVVVLVDIACRPPRSAGPTRKQLLHRSAITQAECEAIKAKALA